MNRRVLLRGLGGALVTAPLLNSVAERSAKAAGDPPPPAPKRLIVLFTHYGCLTSRWFPKKSHGPLLSADYAAMQTLAPMAPYADKLLMVRGIRAMNEWSNEGTLGQKNDPKTQVCGSYFTCQPVTPNADSGFDTSDPSGVSPKTACKPIGRSLDHVCAEQVNANGTPLFMDIAGPSGTNSNTMSVISWDAPQRMFPGFVAPMPLLNQLTKLFGPGPVSPDTYQVLRRKSIIDCVRDDLNTLKRVPMSKADQQKLDAWVALLHDTTSKIVSSQCSMETASKLGLTSERVQQASASGSPDLSKVGPVMMDLAVLSAICDSTRVIFMKFPPNYVFKFLGLNLESASLANRVGSAAMGGPCVANALDMIAKVDAWYAQQFAYLVGRLDGVQEGDRTLLDNSATVWFQQFSDGSAHNLNNLPILQAGSCGGYFKTGWAVNVERGVPDLTQGHSDDDCKDGNTQMPVTLAGTPSGIATQPINKYYCNLMNAIGVKAGPDGFPLKNGTEPVSRYGKYDDTSLFGSDQSTTIKDPGEYAALRAS